MEPDSRLVNALWGEIFRHKYSALYGSLATSMDFIWDDSIPTAATNGGAIYWNPQFFMKISAAQRMTVMVHEIEHVARLHHCRQQHREQERWNWACDFEINNDLENEGHDIKSLNGLVDQSYAGMSAERIYDLLPPNFNGKGNCFDCDMTGGGSGNEDGIPKIDAADIISRVTQAVVAAKMAGKVPGHLKDIIDTYAKPVIPWTNHLHRYLTDIHDQDYTWSRPNRRYQDIYLPSLQDTEEGRLTHIVWFYDVSGSVTREEIIRFNTEVKYVKDVYNPLRLTIITFDTKIQQIFEFTEDEELTSLKISGRGGTCLSEVYDYIVKNKPSASVIFTDLGCAPMPDPKHPVLWGVTGSYACFTPSFGTIMKIPREQYGNKRK